MKVLVTGCAGFIGSNLTDWLLKQGYEVTGIDCFTEYYSKKIKMMNISNALNYSKFKLIEKDILMMEKFPDVDYVFHLAAQAGVRASWGKNFQVYTKNNIEATQRLLEFYKDFDLKKFVYSSSSSVYGDSDLPMNENSLPKPVSPYGVTKLAAEHLCYQYWKNYNIPTISLRYFTVYGERQRPDMAFHKFIKTTLDGENIIVYGNGMQTRDFTYIIDIVEATVSAAECEFEGEVMNIGGGSRVSLKEALEILQNVMGTEIRIKYLETQKGDVKHTHAHISKAKKILGYKPKVDLYTGLNKEFEWIKRIINGKIR